MLRQRAQSISSHRKAQLAERASSMRHQMTASESALWRAICAKQLGVAFRRQYVIAGSYIADFAALEVRLIVEVDGEYHGARVAADARRDRRLARLGWRVVRVKAEVVVGNLAEAVEQVREAVRQASLAAQAGRSRRGRTTA